MATDSATAFLILDVMCASIRPNIVDRTIS